MLRQCVVHSTHIASLYSIIQYDNSYNSARASARVLIHNQVTRSKNHCVVTAHLAQAADVDRFFELKTISSFS